MSKVYSIPIDGVPDGWEPVEIRCPVVGSGETFINSFGLLERADNEATPKFPRLILRKKYTPPAWLKEAGFRWVVRDQGYWYALTGKPEFDEVAVTWKGSGLGWNNLGKLNFTPPELGPDVQDKDTLIEL